MRSFVSLGLLAGMGLIGSAPADCQSSSRPSRPAPKATGYALVIGIGQYKNLPPLKYSERDARDLSSILISPEGGNFAAANVRVLTGAEATQARMQESLQSWLPQASGAQDRVVVYVAGHAFLYNGRTYLAPYDFDPNKASETGYPLERLADTMSRLPSKSKALFLDVAHAGANKGGPEAAYPAGALNRGVPFFALTASQSREVSFESDELQHGVFTYFLIRGLQGEADQNRDGVVAADELADYVRVNVRKKTEGRQNPTDFGGFDPGMVLAFAPAKARPADPVTPKTGTLQFQSNMDGVEVSVDGKAVGVAGKATPLVMPGVSPGSHTVQGSKAGYEPDGPREIVVYPGQKATVDFKIAIVRRRNSAATALLNEGLGYYNKGYEVNLRKAVESFKKALAADPSFAQAALYLGHSYRALYDTQNAERYYRAAIQIDPDSVDARVSLAALAMEAGQLANAERNVREALQREPANPVASELLAQAVCVSGKAAECVDAAKRAVFVAPNSAAAHLSLAEGLRLSKDIKGAQPEYETALRLSNAEGPGARANYFVLGYLAGAGQKRGAQRDPSAELRSQIYFGLCDCARIGGDLPAAIEACQKALASDPGNYLANYELALAYIKDGNDNGTPGSYVAAKKHMQAAIMAAPETEEGKRARQYLAEIDKLLQQAGIKQ